MARSRTRPAIRDRKMPAATAAAPPPRPAARGGSGVSGTGRFSSGSTGNARAAGVIPRRAYCQVMPELLTACAGCGRAMNPGAVLYDTQGRAVCQTCFDKLDLVATDHRAAANIRRAGYVSLAGGVA